MTIRSAPSSQVAIEVRSIALDGPDAPRFLLVGAPALPRSLAPGEAFTFDVVVDGTAPEGAYHYRIDELLAPYDLGLAFGWTGDEEHFHDDRLGRALAETFEAGLMKLQTAAIVRAVQAHELDLRHLHLDTSSVSFYGQ